MMKNYLLNLLQQCSEEKFGQDAIEWAIVSGLVQLTYEFESDIRAIMSRYDEIIEGYRRSLAARVDIPSRQKLAPMKRAVPRRRELEEVAPSIKKSAA